MLCRTVGNAETVVSCTETGDDQTASIAVVRLKLVQALHSLDKEQREHAGTIHRANALEHQCESLGKRWLPPSLLLHTHLVG